MPERAAGIEERGGPAALWKEGKLFRRPRGPGEVLFGQMREDAAVEMAALEACKAPRSAFAIASAGCTAFALLASPIERLDAVDINPAQVHLVELKRAAFESLDGDDLLRFLEADGLEFYPALRPRLGGEARAFWDERRAALARGLNHCGGLEARLRGLRRLFRLMVHGRRTIEAFFAIEDLDEQRRFFRERWNAWRWRLLFRLGLGRPAIGLIYSREVVRRLPADLPGLIEEKTRRVFLDFPIAENPYLWQVFLGRYPPGPRGLPPYLREENRAPIRARLGNLRLACADAADRLEAQPPGSIDFFALSNILEITPPEYNARLLGAAARAARPGAIACLRSILPPADGLPPAAAERFEIDLGLSARLEALGRSPFCTFVRILRVKK